MTVSLLIASCICICVMLICIYSNKNKNKSKNTIKPKPPKNINNHDYDKSPVQLQAQQINLNVANNENNKNMNDQAPHAPKHMIIRAPSSSDINVNHARSDVIELAEVIQQTSNYNKQHGVDTNVIGNISTNFVGESDSSDQELSIVYDEVKTNQRDQIIVNVNGNGNGDVVGANDIVYENQNQKENDEHLEVEGNDLNRYAIKVQDTKVNNMDAKNEDIDVRDDNKLDDDTRDWQNWDSSRLSNYVKGLLKRNNNSQEEIDHFMNNFWINMGITGQTLVRLKQSDDRWNKFENKVENYSFGLGFVVADSLQQLWKLYYLSFLVCSGLSRMYECMKNLCIIINHESSVRVYCIVLNCKIINFNVWNVNCLAPYTWIIIYGS